MLPLHRDLDPTCVRFHLISTFPFKELDQVALDFTLQWAGRVAPSCHPRACGVRSTSCARQGAVFSVWRARLDLSGGRILLWICPLVPVAVPLRAPSCAVTLTLDSAAALRRLWLAAWRGSGSPHSGAPAHSAAGLLLAERQDSGLLHGKTPARHTAALWRGFGSPRGGAPACSTAS